MLSACVFEAGAVFYGTVLVGTDSGVVLAGVVYVGAGVALAGGGDGAVLSGVVVVALVGAGAGVGADDVLAGVGAGDADVVGESLECLRANY